MRISRQLQGIPDASAQPGGSMLITRTEDGATVGSTLTDSEGIATVQTNGSPGPIKTLFTKGNRWQDDSRSIMPTGSMDLCELRNIIDFLHGDGVILGYDDSFAILSSGSGKVSIAGGAAVLDGVLCVIYDVESVSVDNGDIAIVIKQFHSNGRCGAAGIAYSDIGSTTCVPLWRCTISGGSIQGTPTWIATPTLYNGIVQRHPTVMSIVRVTSGSTTSGSGEDADLETSITLETGVVYNVEAHASVITRGRHGSIALKVDGTLGTYQSNGGDRTVKLSNSDSKNITGAGATTVQVFDKSETALTTWVLQGEFGPTINSLAMSSLGQVTTTSAGKPYIADGGNNRLLRFNSDGTYDTSITSLSSVIGACVDSSDNVYLVYVNGVSGGGVPKFRIEKYNSSLVFQWGTSTVTVASSGHLATDGTHVYWAVRGNDTIRKYLCSDGSFVTSWGSTGSGDGQLSTPWGIGYYGSELYVVDQGNSRVEVFNTTGTYQRQWSTNSGARGLVSDDSGDIWVAEYSNNQLRRFSTTGTYQDTISQTAPSGVGRATGDVIWVSNASANTVAKWDETASAFAWDSGLLVVRAVPRT